MMIKSQVRNPKQIPNPNTTKSQPPGLKGMESGKAGKEALFRIFFLYLKGNGRFSRERYVNLGFKQSVTVMVNFTF
jgi:hypothetical protein